MEFTIRYRTLIRLPWLDFTEIEDAAGACWMSMIVIDHQ